MDERILNLSDPKQKAELYGLIGGLRGPHRVSWCRHRPRRTDRQNRYYWPCFVKPFGDFLREQGEMVTDDEAHELMKAKFLRRSVVNPATGEVIGETVPSTTALDTSEFNVYLEQCAYWLADMFHIVVPEPDVWRERDAISAHGETLEVTS